MSIKSIKIKNLLSFDELIIDDFEDINCIVGKNNTGKSNLLKLIKFFYNKLDGKRELPPELNSKYSALGTITINYDMSRIYHIVSSSKILKTNFFKGIHNLFFYTEKDYITLKEIKKENNHTNIESYLELTLKINSNDSVEWSIKDKKVLKVINYLYPFFDIEARHINLYDWNNLWFLISRLKSFNVDDLKQDELIKFLDGQISEKSRSYQKNIDKIQKITKTSKYSYREKVLNYIKVGLKGHTFQIENQDLEIQSDGTNSHKFIEIFLDLFISLSRTEYIEPIVYVDEPEIGLHPKRNEELVYHLYDTYKDFKKTKEEQEIGKYKTPYPKIIFATHSPNIVKQVIKLFEQNQQILHFSKKKNDNTLVQKMHSKYNDKFLNIFSDNEARLFFSSFILFVEGETEVEIFSNRKLLSKFSELKEIDVYKSSSNILSEELNPSVRNTSIPYLFLFDIDKFYQFENQNNLKKMSFKNTNPNLYILPKPTSDRYIKEKILYEIQKYNRGYNKKYNLVGEAYKELEEFHKNESLFTFKFNFFTHKLEKNKLDTFQKNLNIYLNTKQVKYVKTTIEEVLISQDSKELFYKWLKEKYKTNFIELLYRKKILNINRTFYKKRTNKIGNLEILYPRQRVKKEIVFLKKRKYIDSILIDYIRVHYFNGKFEDLEVSISKSSSKKDEKIKKRNEILKHLKSISIPIEFKPKNFNTIVKKFNIEDKDKEDVLSLFKNMGVNIRISEKLEKRISIIFELEEETFKEKLLKSFVQEIKKLKIPNELNKTSGWTTEFLNFAIDEIEQNRGDKNFEDEFKKYFGELYDIITHIKNKL